MNRIKQEILALRKAFGNYLIFRKKPEYYAKNYLFENKGEQYVNWAKTERNRLLKFKNIHQGQDCFIIGNGPSLNKMDLSFLNNYYTFGLNKIFLIFKKVKLNLDYLVAVNPLVIEQSKEEFLQFDIPVFLSYIKKSYNINKSNIFKLYKDVPWGFYTDPISGISEGFTVTYVAMQLAYFMGFKRVFLIGVDHNFVQKGFPNEEQYFDGEDINHFDPDYFKDKNWHLADTEGSESSYYLAKTTFERKDGKILDATLDGKLEVFDKIDIKEALKIAHKKNYDR